MLTNDGHDDGGLWQMIVGDYGLWRTMTDDNDNDVDDEIFILF